jgi:hypothetical protein
MMPWLAALYRGKEAMRKIFPVLVMLNIAGASAAQEARTTPDARPSMPYVGTAVMQDDGSISLRLRLTSDGKPIDGTVTYKVTDRAYDSVLRHLGGLRPGETKQFRPWKD